MIKKLDLSLVTGNDREVQGKINEVVDAVNALFTIGFNAERIAFQKCAQDEVNRILNKDAEE